ncbi:MAG: response regulator transcription factor [Planctomycetota bacterium]|jgi:FixJ family two-component response regulator
MITKCRPIVYIVDDDESVRRGLSRLMHSAEIESVAFASAAEFLESSYRDSNACLVVDVRMPGMTGLELQRELSARATKIPVIFITAYDTEETREEAKRIGALGYFRKPVESHALLDAIEWALARNHD